RSPDPPVRQDPPPPVKPDEPAAPPPPPPAKAAAPPPPAPTRALQESSPLPARAAPAVQGLPPAPAVAEKERPAVGAFIEHLVVPGETLATIAKWYTGETTAWTEIAKHNPGLHPFRLKGGDLVQVPRSLATVHSEQPAHSTAPETVSRPARKTPKAPPAPPPPAATPEHAQPAFGPK
ncbi:MAG: LysM peptidoglycan-binding domain-containing protein, partial [Desulfobacterota bacterium]|nr:LysM peptidoglycan-binding domain-containing protein [Thermodesulfobacteriota bacterium]